MRTDAPDARAAYIAVTTLFLAWGFITAMIDPLIPAVRAIFSLSYTESMLTQFAYFMAYGVISLPAAALVARRGYAAGILYALGAMIVGCLVILLGTQANAYAILLVALFIIASGITILQVAANPLAAALGPPGRSHLRLTLSQAFNSLGTVIAPYIGANLMLRGGIFSDGADAAAQREASLRAIDHSFLMIAALIGLLLVFIALSRRRLTGPGATQGATSAGVGAALRSRWALLGGLAIFLYVGAEVSIGSIMINFLHQGSVLGVTLEKAGKLLSFYWLGAMVGRFAGSVLMAWTPAARLTLIASATAAVLCAVVVTGSGVAAAVAAISIGLFNSILFPTIFTLTLERSTAGAAATSGFLCMSIVGGALLPPLVGLAADRVGLALAFAVPGLAYAAIAAFAYFAARAPMAGSAVTAARAAH